MSYIQQPTTDSFYGPFFKRTAFKCNYLEVSPVIDYTGYHQTFASREINHTSGMLIILTQIVWLDLKS